VSHLDRQSLLRAEISVQSFAPAQRRGVAVDLLEPRLCLFQECEQQPFCRFALKSLFGSGPGRAWFRVNGPPDDVPVCFQHAGDRTGVA
jgi:hypothetical protein